MRPAFRGRLTARARSEDWSDLRLTSSPLEALAWSRSRSESADMGDACWRERDRRGANRLVGMGDLQIANRYNSVDVRERVPRGYAHVAGARLQPLCRRLGIRYAEALVGWTRSHCYFTPVRDGVVVHVLAAPRLLAAIALREQRSQRRQRRI